MSFNLKTSGLAQVQKKMLGLERDLGHPDLSYGVRAMARVWQQNFTSEGSMVGGWRDLSVYTQKKREERGFQPDHPILKQTGALERTTIRSLTDARGARQSRGEGISMASIYSTLSVALRASGAKAENQTGGRSDIKGRRTKSRSRIPARPFWFVNPEVSTAATRGIERWVQKMLRDYR